MSKVRLDDYEAYDWAADKRGWISIGKFEEVGGGSIRHGVFHHWNGTVRIYQQQLIGGFKPTTSLDITTGGRTYYRKWHHVWGDISLSRVARKFANDILGKHPDLKDKT